MNRLTFGNNVLIKLDAENDRIKTKTGVDLFIDISYDMEKHSTVTGIVCGLPSHLSYTGHPDAMPWKCEMEAQIGDMVVVYYLSIVNAFKKETRKYFIENGERYVFVQYSSIYALIRDGKVIPINGYCLIEPMENPELIKQKEQAKKFGLELVMADTKSKSGVVYGRVAYAGKPNDAYIDEGISDRGVVVNTGDCVVMRKVSDIFAQYSLHASIDGGKNYYRAQRKQILAKL